MKFGLLCEKFRRMGIFYYEILYFCSCIAIFLFDNILGRKAFYSYDVYEFFNVRGASLNPVNYINLNLIIFFRISLWKCLTFNDFRWTFVVMWTSFRKSIHRNEILWASISQYNRTNKQRAIRPFPRNPLLRQSVACRTFVAWCYSERKSKAFNMPGKIYKCTVTFI